MARIQDVGIGNYIRNPRGGRESAGVRISDILKVMNNDGNTFRCYPVKSVNSGEATLETEVYYNIPLDAQVDQVTI